MFGANLREAASDRVAFNDVEREDGTARPLNGSFQNHLVGVAQERRSLVRHRFYGTPPLMQGRALSGDTTSLAKNIG